MMPSHSGPLAINAADLHKRFVLHLQGGLELDVLRGANLKVQPGACVALVGPSGAGKSSLMRALYGNYRIDSGSIRIAHDGGMVDIASASPAEILAVRQRSLGYVSQFLRAIPRLSALDVVASSAIARGIDENEARRQAGAMLERLRIPAALHTLPPITFSGGEQQRVNLARSFICDWPTLLLDEPTASLDPTSRDTVCDLIAEACNRGSAIVAIVHDPALRDRIADRSVRLENGATLEEIPA
ncbi:phosphonate C-P lyase system protein PhnL [Gluconobacter sp. Dm-74]|uniref:phosphonate C-P lyase system protein PhnL n=1 Tax=Gluconobacter sp. Dm-74 TaxID=2799803 RepID=UPI002012A1EA|nr:phosphonate C-P lyase system protein PhnL [Gluconobacter sp. Dm-74]